MEQKFNLFNGVFGASDEVLGTIESGVDFEKRILAIYQECRTPEEIDAAFKALQAEMEEQIHSRMEDTRRVLFEHFDEDVHERLRLRLADAQAQLDRVGKRFWSLTRHVLAGRAHFEDAALAFDLQRPPRDDIPAGRYHLISRSGPQTDEASADGSRPIPLPAFAPAGTTCACHSQESRHARIRDPFRRKPPPHPARRGRGLRGKRGYLTLTRLTVESYEREEYLLFFGLHRGRLVTRPGDDGKALSV